GAQNRRADSAEYDQVGLPARGRAQANFVGRLIGSVWPVAKDGELVSVDAGGVAAEWSGVPNSDASRGLRVWRGGGQTLPVIGGNGCRGEGSNLRPTHSECVA